MLTDAQVRLMRQKRMEDELRRWCRCSTPTRRACLQATTLLELLQERHPGRFTPAMSGRLQRRLRDWPADEVMKVFRIQ